MKALQDQGLLIAVLDHLDDVVDMMRCSVVSKSWHKASAQARPARLCISQLGASEQLSAQHDRTPNYADLTSMQQWLQRKHRQGVFQKVEELSISMRSSFTQECCEASLHMFWQDLLQTADSWQVQSCNLENTKGSLEKTVKLLPTTVRHLTLCIGQLTDTISLSLFDRFPHLQSVELRSTNRYFRSTFILHSTLFNLRRSDLLFHEPFRVTRDCSITACQRKYTRVAPHIFTFADSAQKGSILEDIQL